MGAGPLECVMTTPGHGDPRPLKQQPKPPRLPLPRNRAANLVAARDQIPSCLSLWSPPPLLGEPSWPSTADNSGRSRGLCPSGFPGPWAGSAHRSLASSPPHVTRLGEGPSAPVCRASPSTPASCSLISRWPIAVGVTRSPGLEWGGGPSGWSHLTPCLCRRLS